MRFRLGTGVRAALIFGAIILSGCGGTGGVGPSQDAQVGSGASGGSSTIQGRPASVVAVGQAYSFQPVVSGGTAGALTFSASNLPAWLRLDTRTGRLTGTPTAADIATYSGLMIVASDGSSTTNLGPFSITVTAAGSGTASLSWMPPNSNTDGSALTNLAGFVVLYGNEANDLTHSISITNPSISTYVVESLTPGTWYFAVQAVNAAGVRSDASATASKTVS